MLTDKTFMGGYGSNAKFDFSNFDGLNIPNILSVFVTSFSVKV